MEFIKYLKAENTVKIFNFLKKGIDVNSRCDFNDYSFKIYEERSDMPTILQYCILKKKNKSMKEILKFNPNVNAVYEGGSALTLSIRSRNEFAFDEIVKRGGNVNQVDKSGYSPLMRAIITMKISSVIKLIDYGADIIYENSAKATPLLVAIGHGKIDCVELLVKKGASPKKGSDGWKRIVTLANKKKSLPIMNILGIK